MGDMDIDCGFNGNSIVKEYLSIAGDRKFFFKKMDNHIVS